MPSPPPSEDYLLGHDAAELERLERQAAVLAPATTTLLRMAGVTSGMRVLDLGTGAGDVAFLAAELVGPKGSVVGLDRSAEALATARARAARRGVTNATFVAGDVREFRADGTFDAIVGRLVLLYAPDPASVLRHHASALRPGGIALAMEYDMPPARAVPACSTVAEAARWVHDAFERAGLDPTLGTRLVTVFRDAGLDDAATLGMQPYLAPDAGAGMLAGIVRTLLPVIEQTGVATAAEIDLATLEARLATEMHERNAVLAPPTLVGAWTTL